MNDTIVKRNQKKMPNYL